MSDEFLERWIEDCKRAEAENAKLIEANVRLVGIWEADTAEIARQRGIERAARGVLGYLERTNQDRVWTDALRAALKETTPAAGEANGA